MSALRGHYPFGKFPHHVIGPTVNLGWDTDIAIEDIKRQPPPSNDYPDNIRRWYNNLQHLQRPHNRPWTTDNGHPLDPLFLFIIFLLVIASVAWLILAAQGARRQKQLDNARATALATRLLCPTCKLPTLHWTQESWNAELQYLDGSVKPEQGFTFQCSNCDQTYDFTTDGEYREASDD
jgi:hypothetical protein